MNDSMLITCDVCLETAHEPYVECCECETNLCMSCFATGREVKNHKNNHKYAIRRNDFPLFDNCNWTAKEESKLLSALGTYGYGNWEEISKSVHTRSKLECQEHYKKYYIENIQYNELRLIPETEQSMFPKPVIPYLYNTNISLYPPRNNQSDQHLPGYNAYRSEFELSYDSNAETIFNIEDQYSEDEEDQDIMDALKISLVNALNNRLKERHRRYKIIQSHGLITPNKLIHWLNRFENTLTRQKVQRLLVFMNFMTGMQFDAFVEQLSLEKEIFQQILRLYNYRTLGIKTIASARLYNHLRKDNEVMMKEQKQFTSLMSKKFESQSPIKSRLLMSKENKVNRYKRTAMPLEITDMPGYHLLSDGERLLCSNLRLLPDNYREIKMLLIKENSKFGSIRLLDARRIIKIDVNKTKKIYDFLLDDGVINKPA